MLYEIYSAGQARAQKMVVNDILQLLIIIILWLLLLFIWQ